jgi:hypothetical protein
VYGLVLSIGVFLFVEGEGGGKVGVGVYDGDAVRCGVGWEEEVFFGGRLRSRFLLAHFILVVVLLKLLVVVGTESCRGDMDGSESASVVKESGSSQFESKSEARYRNESAGTEKHA